MTQSEQTCYIEFRVHDENRLKVFERFVRALRARAFAGTPEPVQVAEDATQKGRSYDTPEDWLLLFHPNDLVVMGMPDHMACLTALRSWRGLSRGERRTAINKDTALQVLADFADMVKRLSQVRYHPMTCEKTRSDIARMEFITDEPYFTERDSLEDLLLFFGFFNIVDEGC